MAFASLLNILVWFLARVLRQAPNKEDQKGKHFKIFSLFAEHDALHRKPRGIYIFITIQVVQKGNWTVNIFSKIKRIPLDQK